MIPLAPLKHLVTVMNQFSLASAEPLKAPHTRLFQDRSRWREEMAHFVRALSHDMGANFMVLENTFSQLKQAVEQSEQSKQLLPMVSHMEACLEESRRFLDDLILLAKTGQVDMEPARVELGPIINEVLYEQRDLIHTRRVCVDVGRLLPDVWCNRKRIKQVITNLIRNALKHGCDSTDPKIIIRTFVDQSQLIQHKYPTLNLLIEDNGPGIENRYWDQIFAPGIRLPGVVAEGSGIGLSIVRKVAEFYGGTAKVEEGELGGLAVGVQLPAAVRESGEIPKSPTSAAGGSNCHSVVHDSHGREQGVQKRHPLTSILKSIKPS
jgi:signal transduction histidine kinase